MPYKDQIKNIVFPVGGIDRSMGYQSQPPYTTPSAQNVRPRSTKDKRMTGGERPGLTKYFYSNLGGPIRMMDTISTKGDRGYTVWYDFFNNRNKNIVHSHEGPTRPWYEYYSDGSVSFVGPRQPGWWHSGDKIYIFPDQNADQVYYWRRPSDVDVKGIMIHNGNLSIDNTQPYTIDLYVFPWDSVYCGEYFIYARLNDTNYPNLLTQNGIRVTFTPTQVLDDAEEPLATNKGQVSLDGYASGVLTEYTSANPTMTADDWTKPVKFSVTIDGDDISVYVNDTIVINSETVASHSGFRFGFGMSVINAGIALVDGIRMSYYEPNGEVLEREVFCVSANQKLYVGSKAQRLEEVTSTCNLADRRLLSAERGSELFIADYSEEIYSGTCTVNGDTLTDSGRADWTDSDTNNDLVVVYNGGDGVNQGAYKIANNSGATLTVVGDMGSGSAEYEIYRAPKVYNPDDNTLSLWMATDGLGYVPLGYDVICAYRDRIVLGGLNGYAMSRSGDAYDWDYFPEEMDRDLLRPVAGTITILGDSVGQVNQPIIAMIPSQDDYLIFGCKRSVHILRGDPAAGGFIDVVTSQLGFLSKTSWCITPEGIVVFLSQQGINYFHPGAYNQGVQSITESSIPDELFEIDTDKYIIEMEFDIRDNGIHIYTTPRSGGDHRVHWWLDWPTKSFWANSIDYDHEPTSVARYNRYVMIGGRDGYIRNYDEDSLDDDGEDIDSYVYIGPIRLGGGQYLEGILENLAMALDVSSGNVQFDIHVGRNAQEAFRSQSKYTGTLTAGYNRTYRPRIRGGDMFIKLSNVGSAEPHWIFDSATINIHPTGKARP